jgi:ATP-dependent DNA helicase RecG
VLLRPDVLAALDAVAAGAAASDQEMSTLDFKTVGRSINDTLQNLALAAACFANAQGGTIVVGVRDRPGGPGAFVGCSLEPAQVRLQIFEKTDPHLTVQVAQHRHSAGAVLQIDVPEGAVVHSVSGKYVERIGSSCMPMSALRIERVARDRRGVDWSSEPTDKVMGDVDPLAMAVARRFLSASLDPARRSYAALPDADLLRAVGVVDERDRLNRAGELLLARSMDGPERLAYVHRRTPAGAMTANESFRAPLLPAIDRVFDLISARIDRTSVDLAHGVQVQVGDLPEAAVREAVINAVMHRDYVDTSRVMVEHAATRLAVTSPGPFVSGISPSNVLTVASRSRNPRLAEAVRKLGLAETAGTGVDRMYAAMNRLGHQPPEFHADEATVRVTLLGGAPNQYVTRFVSTLPAGTGEDADAMLVLLTLLGRKTVTATELTAPLQKPVTEVRAVLQRLASTPFDVVEPTRESARRTDPAYRLREAPLVALGPAVAYRRPSVDSIDRKVLALLREAQTINSRMVRLVLDTDTVTTSRILADLVERGWLVKTSRAARGPSVTYGPGPSLPHRGSRRPPG